MASTAWAQEKTHLISPFLGLNNTNDPIAININQAQDLLNVDITPGGKSVKKRMGFGLAYNLAITTSPGHGAFSFFNSDRSDVQLYFHDTYAQASVAGAALTTLFSNGSPGASYQCVDSQGNAYCVSTARITPFYTDGTTTTNLTEASTGTMVAVSRDRLAIAGMSHAPNRIDFSQSGDFTEWTVGGDPSSPLQETISSPGSRITHLTHAFGRWVWFKDESFGYVLEGRTLADWEIEVISPNIGTNDNSSYYDNGILYFRGQDGHIYAWDGAYSIIKVSKDIEGSVNASQFRIANSWLQTTKADFDTGRITPTGWNDNQTTPGDVLNKKAFFEINSVTEFTSGTYPYENYVDTTTVLGGLSTLYPDPFNSWRISHAWAHHAALAACAGNMSASGGILTIDDVDDCGQAGMRTAKLIQDFGGGTTFYIDINDSDATTVHIILNDSIIADGTTPNTGTYWNLELTPSGSSLTVSTHTNSAGDVLTTNVDPAGMPSNIELWLDADSWSYTINDDKKGSGSHTWGNRPVYVYIEITAGSDTQELYLDHFGVAPATMVYISESYDTTMTNSNHYWDEFYEYSTGTGTISYLTASNDTDNDNWTSTATVTNGNAPTSATERYIHLQATFSITNPAGEPLALSSYTLGAFTYGSWDSVVNEAPNLTSWDTFSASLDTEIGSHTFYIRASTETFSQDSSTPTWTAVDNNSIPAISTGSFFQIRDDFWVDQATATAKLFNFTVNWFEGQASDKAYVEMFEDAIWWAVASGESQTTNNRILKYDLINQIWTVYDIDSNGMLIRNNSLYFISASTGAVYKYGDSSDDNGEAIEAYWKSKDLFFDTPYQDKEFMSLSLLADSVDSSTITITYNIDASSEIARDVYLYDSGNGIKVDNYKFPAGKTGKTLSIKLGNNASNQDFEVFATQIGYITRPWRVE